MSTPVDRSEPSERELAELSALADGRLDPARRAEVEARISASPQLTALYERERRVVELMHEATAVHAPAGLRARIEASRPSRPARVRRRALYGGSLAGALAAVALALVLILPAGTPGSPSVSQAAALAMLGASSPAPGPEHSKPGRLDANVEDLYFPNWAADLGWQASGVRTDRINGRLAVTVYYGAGSKTVAYTIVGAPVLKEPAVSATTMHGVVLRTLKLNGRTVVTWREGNHTCVLSGTGVSAADLQHLAAWSA